MFISTSRAMGCRSCTRAAKIVFFIPHFRKKKEPEHYCGQRRREAEQQPQPQGGEALIKVVARLVSAIAMAVTDAEPLTLLSSYQIKVQLKVKPLHIRGTTCSKKERNGFKM